MISLIIFTLCAVTSLLAGLLLLRAYRQGKVRLLFWSGLCFLWFALNNIFLIIDKRILPAVDLSALRSATVLVGLCCLLYGLIWDSE